MERETITKTIANLMLDNDIGHINSKSLGKIGSTILQSRIVKDKGKIKDFDKSLKEKNINFTKVPEGKIFIYLIPQKSNDKKYCFDDVNKNLKAWEEDRRKKARK